MAERVGFEPTRTAIEVFDDKNGYANEQVASSRVASRNADLGSPALAKVVHAWDSLHPELRAAILAIIAAAKK